MLSSGVFPTRLNLSEVKHIFKEEIKMIHLIIGLFLCSHQFQRFLKRLSIIDYIIILIIITFLLMNNSVSGIHHQETYMLTTNILTALNNKLLVGGIFATFIRHLTVSTVTSFCLKWSFMAFREKLIT